MLNKVKRKVRQKKKNTKMKQGTHFSFFSISILGSISNWQDRKRVKRKDLILHKTAKLEIRGGRASEIDLLGKGESVSDTISRTSEESEEVGINTGYGRCGAR